MILLNGRGQNSRFCMTAGIRRLDASGSQRFNHMDKICNRYTFNNINTGYIFWWTNILTRQKCELNWWSNGQQRLTNLDTISFQLTWWQTNRFIKTKLCYVVQACAKNRCPVTWEPPLSVHRKNGSFSHPPDRTRQQGRPLRSIHTRPRRLT